jgi:hypothetical protein
MQTETRGEPCTAFNSLAIVQSLGESAGKNGKPFQARILGTSLKALRIDSDIRLRTGSVVRVEVADQMVLGEVCYCVTAPGESFSMGIIAKHTLAGLAQLTEVMGWRTTLITPPRIL